jgi:hypothetical protein
MAQMAIREDMLELLRSDAAFREEVRRQLLTEEVLGLPAVVRGLAEAQRRTEEQLQRLGERLDLRIEQMAEQLQRLGERLDLRIEQMAEQLQRLGERLDLRIERLAEQVEALVSWQRGEAGRRAGERYEREIVRRALALFNGGEGGAADEPWVRQRLAELLRARLDEGIVGAEEDPALADVLWWKRGQVAVVEASLQVNGGDVARAARRAATLGRAGARALAVVIGNEWATPGAAREAQALGVEWKVGPDLSDGFLAFRRQSAT